MEGYGGGLWQFIYAKGVQKFLLTFIGQRLQRQQQLDPYFAECQEQWPQGVQDVPSAVCFAVGSIRSPVGSTCFAAQQIHTFH